MRNGGDFSGVARHSSEMRCITYAGETVITSDDVASTLVELTAALAKRGQAEAVRVPIVIEKTGDLAWAEMVVGVGNDVLSVPHAWDEPEADFSEEAADLRRHLESVRPTRVAEVIVGGQGRASDDEGDRFFDLDVTFDDGLRG